VSAGDQLRTTDASVAADVKIGHGSVIHAQSVSLGTGVRIGDAVNISCDRLEVADGCSIGEGAQITSPEITLGEGCSIAEGLVAELDDHLRLGDRSSVGRRVKMVGRGFACGCFLWMKDEVLVGGGGALGPDSYLRVGDRTSIFDRAFVNVSNEVTIGSDSALSFGVAVLTHAAWQPALLGFPIRFEPVRVGDHSVVYIGSIVLPGVEIGNYSTVGAGSVVLHDVPDRTLAAGNPARVLKRWAEVPDAEAGEELVREVMRRWARTLPMKGITVIENRLTDGGALIVQREGTRETIALRTSRDRGDLGADLVLAFGPPTKEDGGACHFDLVGASVTGEPSRVAEDLRDFLRRNAVRIFTDRPFRSLPPANLDRLRSRRTEEPANAARVSYPA
jgi:acetyltransferase-like isoleucine patch superfamily enzyme